MLVVTQLQRDMSWNRILCFLFILETNYKVTLGNQYGSAIPQMEHRLLILVVKPIVRRLKTTKGMIGVA